MSEKTAKRLRKRKFPPKKILALCAGLCVSYAPIAAESEFLVTLFGTATKPFGEAHQMQYGMGGGVKLTYRPVKFLNIFAQGEYLSMQMPGIDPIAVMDASLGTGYHLGISDRMGLDFNISGGAYKAEYNKNSINGFTAGASIVFSYKFSPVVSMDVAASGTHYAYNSSPLMMINGAVSPGLTFNLSELYRPAKVGVEVEELAPVFPALYSWYDKNSFGKAIITNNEDTAITDVTISFFQPQYMAHAKECVTIRNIEKGQSVEVDLIAFFNEQMLELTERSDTNSVIIVNYLRLGRKCSKSFKLDVPVYGRNNMSWDDDRRAAVFVSSKDPAAMHFAKYVTSIVREKKRVSVPVNIQYAMGIFEALNEFGINYVVDPSSAFADNVGTASIDFLQFPYQTLMYKGGDCDDLSILVCSLFEAVGIRTAFITIPGHIFMAFDSGMTVEEAEYKLRNLGNYIEIEDEVWIPLEITLSDEGFYKAYKYGAREWNKSFEEGTAAIYRMQDSWKIYPPISVPGAAAKFTMPASKNISVAFERSVDQWCYGELQDLLVINPAKLALDFEEEIPESETVVKEDPLAPDSLYEVLSLSGQSFAMLTTTGVKERKRDDDDKDEPGLEPDPEDEEPEEDDVVVPLIAVDVLGPEALGLKVPVSENKFVSKFEERQANAEKKSEAISEKKAETPAVEKVAEKVAETPVTEKVAVVPATEKVADAPVTEKVAAIPETEKVAEAPMTEKVSTVPVTEKVAEVPVTEKIAEAPVAEKSAETPVTEKVAAVPATEKVTEAPAAVKSDEAPVSAEAETKSANHAPVIAISITGVGLLALASAYQFKKKKEEEGDK